MPTIYKAVVQKADKYCFMCSHPDKHNMSVSKYHFERPHNTGFDIAELFSVQEPIGVHVRGGFIVGDEKDIQASALLNCSRSEFRSETAA